jgi:hypothetical protein
VGIVATVLTSGLPWQNPISASLFGAPLTLVFTALILNRLMPRIYDRPGLCRRCGYDIRASFEMGRCPECGRPFAEPLSRNDKTPAGWKKTIWMIWNHPNRRRGIRRVRLFSLPGIHRYTSVADPSV